MEVKHLKEMTASALTANYLALTNSSVVFTANGGQVQSKSTQAASTIQSILTGLVVLVGICATLFIIIKRMPDVDNPRGKSEVYRAIDYVVGLVALATAVVWLLPWIYNLFT